MSMNLIYTAFIAKLNTLTPLVDTVYENKPYSPIDGKEYQELYIKPSGNKAPYINEIIYEMSGFIQITLCYPPNEGRSKAMSRADLYEKLFPSGTVLTIDSLRIRTKGVPQTTNLGIVDGRYKIALRVGFLAVL